MVAKVVWTYPKRSAGFRDVSGRPENERTKEPMARQKSDRRVVPQSRRKTVSTAPIERERGGKATTVEQRTWRLELSSETAEAPQGTVGGAAHHPWGAAPHAAPKSENKGKTVTSATTTMDEVVSRLLLAFQAVASNQGAPGPDGQSIEQVREHLGELLPELAAALLAGTYEPGNIRRVWIPKSGGGERGLGIPNVVDRVVQQAVRQVLEPVYEPMFHASSHGFRPERSCHTAIAEARRHLQEGYEWVVDLDLEKFFDRVHHQRLMARLAERVDDKRLLVLIGKMLKVKVVMPDGVVVSTDEGVPQGGPLSPLLSNIVLNELDRELDQRGHRFVRYADDCNIYVRSERAGQRVMASIVRFIERRLRLRVNANKSAVARPEDRHFVGFRLRREPLDGEVEVLLSKRSQDRLDGQVRELTPRNWGATLAACIQGLNAYLLGWLGFFGSSCTAGVERTLSSVDAHIRRRLRAIQARHWKTRRTMVRKLIRLGVQPNLAWKTTYLGRRSTWALSRTPAMHQGLRNAYFAERGLVSLADQYRARFRPLVAPGQLQLALG